ncbi:unnamed protein product [Rotaria socialis]|uniref:mitogen-activated protein kinase kinase kinase n=1 Tax=Rotaria socialis TaxID=392032 RepID=A0A817Y3J5_9BILA|nr:unnamed protein product [Rotaria socialis]
MTNSSSLTNKNDEILHVLYDYTSKEADELTLKRGSIVAVLSKDENISGSKGWWTGRLLDSESVGIFPANFVASSEPNLRIIDEKELQIGNLIGIGGFGHVHHGKFGDVDIAIKTAKSLTSFSSTESRISNPSNDDESANAAQKSLVDGLLREARLFANLRHANIIQLFGVSPSVSTRSLYLVMEYAHGGALDHLLQRRKCGLYPNVFIQYAKQIADGMRYLHEEGTEHIIHRDLKCSNILILEAIQDIHNDNELLYKTLKITDFGLAKKQIQSSSMSAAGTFPWMSPECIRSNEFSTKSDVWSFGVLLWECLTGEIPYKGFDQMQVAFGIATNKYSLPIPSTCPEEFSQLMKDCWQPLPQDRPTFTQLYEQINRIIDTNYAPNKINNMEPNEETYFSLQQDWRKEIQDIFEELKIKEQEIRDREQEMIRLTIEQNHQRMVLEKWEHDLHEREMHISEREFRLLESNNIQDRLNQQTPKVQKRSGHFVRSLLHATFNGSATLSSTTASNLISGPTNFRHLARIHPDSDPNNLHHHYFPAIDYDPASHTGQMSPLTNKPIFRNTTKKHSDCQISKSTPSTPNLSRLRTLTLHYPAESDDFDDNTNEKSTRSSSVGQAKLSPGTLSHLRWRKPKACTGPSSSTIKRKHVKSNARLGKPKWYLDTSPSRNSNSNNNDDDSTTISSTKSTPTIDRSAQKLGSSSSSTCSTPNDRSLARGIFDINSVLMAIGLGHRTPARLNSSPLISSSTSSSVTTIPKTLNQPMLRSASEVTNKQASSTSTTPSPATKKQHKRTCSTPLTDTLVPTNGYINVAYQPRPSGSLIRPNSRIISSKPSHSSSTRINISQSDSHLVNSHLNHRNPATTTTTTNNVPQGKETMAHRTSERFYLTQSSEIHTHMVPSIASSSNMSASQPQLHFSSILDIDSEEQRKHRAQVLAPKTDRKN